MVRAGVAPSDHRQGAIEGGQEDRPPSGAVARRVATPQSVTERVTGDHSDHPWHEWGIWGI